MNKEDFAGIVQGTIDRTAALLVSKNNEYANSYDVLHNFKRNATRNGHTVLEEWMTYWNKHIDSIHSYMARVKNEATRLALLEVTADDRRALSNDDGVARADAVDPAKFVRRVDNYIPEAMRAIDSTLSEAIEGRFDDNINYSILCQAILKELRRDNEG